MVDVSSKEATERRACAEGRVLLSPEAMRAVTEQRVKKGDVLQIAQLAGIMGAKRTADIIPLCHPIPVDGVDVSIVPEEGCLRIVATVRSRWRTGVEMEALCAVSAAALTVYDMVKSMDRGAELLCIRLLDKSGGRSGDWKRE
jgi:cyclic pyranopterin monophosphate synthase